MNIVGPPLGKIAIVPDSYPVWNCNQAIVVFRPFLMDLNKYIYQFLCTKLFLLDLELIGTAGQDNISVTKSRNIKIPLPPLTEQHRIVQRIEELFAICDRFKAQLQERQQVNEYLVKGLVQEVLEGAGSAEKEVVPVEDVGMGAEPEEQNLTKQQIAFLQILCIAHALDVLRQRKMLQGEMGLAKYIYLVDRIGGVDTKFKFEQNNFGPYPSNFKRRLFTRSKYFYKAGHKGYEVIDLTNNSNRLFSKDSENTDQIQKSMQSLVDIFEPYQKKRAHKLELLASICWLVEKTKKTDFDTIWDELENWNTPNRDDVDRKSELFTQKEVKASLKYIITNDWDKKLKN